MKPSRISPQTIADGTDEELRRETFNGRALLVVRQAAGAVALVFASIDDRQKKITRVLGVLRLNLAELNAVADMIDEVATDLEGT